MFFYTFIDPQTIDDAQAHGRPGLQNLSRIVRGFNHNCLVFDYYDGRVQTALGEKVRSLPEEFINERKRIKKLLSRLRKRNRFNWLLHPREAASEEIDAEEVEAAMHQAVEQLIDSLLVSEDISRCITSSPDQVELTTLFEYLDSNFETLRKRWEEDGLLFGSGSYSEGDFLDMFLHKAVKYAKRIEIYDRLMGRHYGDNYKYTITQFLTWLREAHDDPSTCRVTLHCEKPKGRTEQYMIDTLSPLCASFDQAKMQFYHPMDEPDQVERSMPHHRYIITDQLCIGIDRGMDFLDRHSNTNRDVSMDYKSSSSLKGILKGYEGDKDGSPITL